MRAYHFLSLEHALNDIALQRIRISRYSDLNDPFELFAGNMGDERERRAIRKMKEHFNQTKGIICFSRNWKNPVLWSHYASKHRGVCLGFDINDEFVGEIRYTDQRFPMEYEPDGGGVKPEYLTQLVLTKFKHWSYEDEIRLTVGLDEGTMEGGSCFLPFSPDIALAEVILGPLCELPIDATKRLVDGIYKDVRVHKARLAFNEFAVVFDQRHESGNDE